MDTRLPAEVDLSLFIFYVRQCFLFASQRPVICCFQISYFLVFPKVLGHLAKTYVDTISSGAVPCVENAVIALSTIENEAALQEGLEVYQSGMEKLKKSFPLELNEITSEHQCFNLMATQTFMKRSFRDTDGKYLTSLEVGRWYTKLQKRSFYDMLSHGSCIFRAIVEESMS